jgi:hypothetical protein
VRSALSLSQERSRATFSGLVKLGIASIDDRAVEVLVWSLTEDSNRTPSIQGLPIASAAGLLANRPLLREDFDPIMAVIGQHAGRCTSYDRQDTGLNRIGQRFEGVWISWRHHV